MVVTVLCTVLISISRSNSSDAVNNWLSHHKTRRGYNYYKRRSLSSSNPTSSAKSRLGIIYLCKHSSAWANLLNWNLVGSRKGRCKVHQWLQKFLVSKNRIGGGVGILTSDKLIVTKLHSHTTHKFSAYWILLQLLNVPVIVGCVYHQPNADNNATLNFCYCYPSISQISVKVMTPLKLRMGWQHDVVDDTSSSTSLRILWLMILWLRILSLRIILWSIIKLWLV